jgi:hypothetical protein
LVAILSIATKYGTLQHILYVALGRNLVVRAKQPSDSTSGGVKFRSRKRVYAGQAPTEEIIPRKNTAQPDACLTPFVPPPRHPNVSQTVEHVGNFGDGTPHKDEGKFYLLSF